MWPSWKAGSYQHVARLAMLQQERYNSAMKTPSLAVIAATLALALLGHGGCGCRGGNIARPYPQPTVQALLDHLAGQRERARSFQVESVMDYWVGDDRVKGTVLLMGERGARVRINALNPTGGNVAADLACDGVDFRLIDYNNDCQLTGPCTRDSIAQLLRVSLEPDDFLLLVMGSTPMIASADASLAWDADHGHEVVTLHGQENGLTQTISLRGATGDGQWDVVSSVVRDSQGKVLWNLQNKDFRTVKAEDGTVFRVPGKTRFTQPQDSADLLVRWQTHTLNPTLDAAKFQMDIPSGLRRCGS